MKASFIIAASLMITASFPAFAQTERMSDGRYIAASRCVAYAELPQLSEDIFDYSSLKAAIDDQRVSSLIRERVRDNHRDAVLASQRAGDNAVAISDLRVRRDAACSNFVSSGLVQAGATTPAT